MNSKDSLLEKSVSSKDLFIDPENKNYTIPRAYGVYEICVKKRGKKYRFGNHPIREKVLEREFKRIKTVAVFYQRGSAKELAELLNSENS